MSASFNSFAWTPRVPTTPRVDMPPTQSSNQPDFQMPQSIRANLLTPQAHFGFVLASSDAAYHSFKSAHLSNATRHQHSVSEYNKSFHVILLTRNSERTPNHGQPPSESRSKSHSPPMTSPRLSHALPNRILLPSFAALQVRRGESNLDPRLSKKSLPDDATLDDRIREFERGLQTLNSSQMPVGSPVSHRPGPLGSATAEHQRAVHVHARSTMQKHMEDNNLTDNDVHPRGPVSTKRSRSPEDEQGPGSDSADGANQFSQHRLTKVQETGRRRRLSRNSEQPDRTTQSHASGSEDGDSLFIPLKTESAASAASSDTDVEIVTTTTTTPSARELKQRLAGKHFKDFSRKVNPEKDPENIAIKRMRCVERMQFDDIADVLNKQRVSKGLEPTFTNNAVYGRFQRIAPRIAALEGQPDFNYRDYLHIPREPRSTPARPVALPSMSPHQERLFVEAYEMVKREVWVYTAAKFEEMGGFHLSPEQAALKFKSI
ncbi:uncharacterized protein J3D65DRAFT_692888 [Phyllosticta citribraziliensis]|uniref:Uncharacterized protein n=1 Tax=Phyllosticta citribraziliensis TaxID=989973 RepID=A0ABR1LXC5_9PEZI